MNIYNYAKKYKNLLNQLPGFVQLNALDYKLAFVNSKVAKLIGYTNSSEAKGIFYHEMKCPAAEDHQIFEAQDALVFANQKKIFVFCYHHYKNGWTTLLYEKAPIFNEDGDLIGMITHGSDVTNYNLIDYSRFLFESGKKNLPQNKKAFSYIVEDETNNKYKLSERQLECLFFLLRGKATKEIASILSLSPRTVESYINEIKFKMGCLNRAHIIEKAFYEGLFNLIPKSFFKDK